MYHISNTIIWEMLVDNQCQSGIVIGNYYFLKQKNVSKKREDRTKKRRADVLLINHNFVVEFQHSQITAKEVNERKIDYEKINAVSYGLLMGQTQC